MFTNLPILANNQRNGIKKQWTRDSLTCIRHISLERSTEKTDWSKFGRDTNKSMPCYFLTNSLVIAVIIFNNSNSNSGGSRGGNGSSSSSGTVAAAAAVEPNLQEFKQKSKETAQLFNYQQKL